MSRFDWIQKHHEIIEESTPGLFETAIKHDAGKPDYSLLPLKELEPVIRVLQYGAKKYSRDNYKVGDGHKDSRLISACLRHISAYQSGEKVDPETNESHIAHAMCCLIFMLYNHAHNKPVHDLF